MIHHDSVVHPDVFVCCFMKSLSVIMMYILSDLSWCCHSPWCIYAWRFIMTLPFTLMYICLAIHHDAAIHPDVYMLGDSSWCCHSPWCIYAWRFIMMLPFTLMYICLAIHHDAAIHPDVYMLGDSSWCCYSSWCICLVIYPVCLILYPEWYFVLNELNMIQNNSVFSFRLFL